MEKDSGKKLAELAVDGGMSNSDLTMQVSIDAVFYSRDLIYTESYLRHKQT